MGTLTLSPLPSTAHQLTCIFNHYGLTVGDLVSATHTCEHFNETDRPLQSRDGVLFLKPKNYMYKTLTSPKLPTATINPTTPASTWTKLPTATPVKTPRIYSMADIEGGALPPGTRLLAGHSSNPQNLVYHFVVAYGCEKEGGPMRTGVIQCDPTYKPHYSYLRQMSAANPCGFHAIVNQPKVLSHEENAASSPTPAANPESSSMRHQITSIVGRKPAPTPSNPDATVEVILEGPTTSSLLDSETSLTVQKWLFTEGNLKKAQDAGVNPGSIQVVHSVLTGTPSNAG